MNSRRFKKEDASLRANARTLIETGRLSEVEVTPDALRSYLNARLGSDDRISDFTCEVTSRILRSFGFQDLGQVDECITGLDDDKLSRIALGGRGGQVSRFEVMLATSTFSNLFGTFSGTEWSVLHPSGVQDILSLFPIVPPFVSTSLNCEGESDEKRSNIHADQCRQTTPYGR